MRFIFGILVLSFLVTTGAASFAASVTNCHRLTKAQVRLSCYDAATGFSSETSSAIELIATDVTGPITPKTWQLATEVSPFDDTTNVFLSLESDAPIPGRFGGKGPAVLRLQCQEDTTMAFIYFNGNRMSDDQSPEVDYRLDKKEAQQIIMQASIDRRSLGVWSGKDAIPLIKSMIGHDTLLVRATPFAQNPVVTSFTITGLADALTPLREACDW